MLLHKLKYAYLEKTEFDCEKVDMLKKWQNDSYNIM